MRKVYYRYNPQTLSYEQVFPSWKQRIWTVFRHLLIGIIIGIIGFALVWYVFDSPWEIELKQENRLLLTQYEILSRRIEENQKIMDELQQRDDKLYRAIFHTDPIPTSIRKSGYGSASRYEHLMSLSNSKLVISTTQKLDALTRQLYVQSNSFDEIVELFKTQEDRLRCIPAIQPVASKDLAHVASGYGMRIDPIYRTPRFHAGMDFTAKTGTDIYATGDGVIEEAGLNTGGYGNCIVVNHGYNFKTRYAHCHTMSVKVGQKVKRGEVIATVGNTGKSTGPHLHYEVLVKGQADNPAKYYFMDLTPEEYEQMLQVSENRGQMMD